MRVGNQILSAPKRKVHPVSPAVLVPCIRVVCCGPQGLLLKPYLVLSSSVPPAGVLENVDKIHCSSCLNPWHVGIFYLPLVDGLCVQMYGSRSMHLAQWKWIERWQTSHCTHSVNASNCARVCSFLQTLHRSCLTNFCAVRCPLTALRKSWPILPNRSAYISIPRSDTILPRNSLKMWQSLDSSNKSVSPDFREKTSNKPIL